VVNEVALTSGTDADDDEPLDGVLPLDGVPPDELLPHAVATSPTPRSAAAIARLLVKGKVFLLGRAGQPAWLVGLAFRTAFVQSSGPYGRSA
jgi:hypothetical protein